MAINRRVLKNTLILTVFNYVNACVNFLLFVLLARALPVEAFGAFSASMAIALFAFQLCELGVSQILTKRVAQERERTAALLSSILSLRVLLAAGGLAALGVACWVLPSQSSTRTLTLLLGIAALLEYLTEVFIAVFRGHERMSFEAWVNGARAVVTFTGGALAILAWPTAGGAMPLGQTLAVVFCVGGAVKFLAGFALVGRQVGWRLGRVDGRQWGEFLRESAALGVAKMLTQAVNRLDMIILVAVLGEREAGLYGPAHHLYAGLMILWNAFLLSVFPRLAWMFARDVAAFWSEWKRAAAVVLAVTIVIAALGLAWGPQLLLLIYGSAYAASGGAFQFLVVANIFFALGSLCGVGLTAMGHTGTILLIHAVKVGVCVAAHAILIPRHGFMGAAAATLLTHGVGCLVLVAALSRKVAHRAGSATVAPQLAEQEV